MRPFVLLLLVVVVVAGCGKAPAPDSVNYFEPLLVVKVDSISCEGCCNTIKEELAAIPGVKNVEADPTSKLVQIQVADASFDSKVVMDRLKEIKYDECKIVKDVKN